MSARKRTHEQRLSPALEQQPPAPVYAVKNREVFAVEHPMIIKNLDNALKTFGTNRPFRRILDSDDPEECLPLYLRPNDPMCVPILSHNGPTTNVLLQITVPQRTGRKRKRGSQDPFADINEPSVATDSQGVQSDQQALPSDIASRSRRDNPVTLKRIMRDNIDNYTFEAVAKIKHTHRYRGMSDFQQSTSHGSFIPRIKESILTGEISKMRNFKFDMTRGTQPMGEILPPPSFTHHSIPFNWAWQQNPNIFIETDIDTGTQTLVNHSANVLHTAKYLPRDATEIPTRGPPILPLDKPIHTLLEALKEAFDERPLWTRRGLMNRVGHFPSFYLLRNAIPFIGYMFKGGPFRDCIIKYGIDPRTDPKYRKYQVFFFKLFSKDDNNPGDPWEEMRTSVAKPMPGEQPQPKDTHLFDGVNLTLDGKIWQVCDITDPLLKSLVDSAPYPTTCDIAADGWFTNGRLAKIKAIMKVKLVAIRTNKPVTDDDFADALKVPDFIPDKINRNIHVPTPDLRLTDAEIKELEEKGVDLKGMGVGALRKKVTKGFAKRARGMGKAGERRGKYKRKGKAEKIREISALLGMTKDSVRGSKASVPKNATVDAVLNHAAKQRRREAKSRQVHLMPSIEESGPASSSGSGTKKGAGSRKPYSSHDGEEEEEEEEEGGGSQVVEDEEEDDGKDDSDETETSLGSEVDDDDDDDDDDEDGNVAAYDSDATDEADFTRLAPSAAPLPPSAGFTAATLPK